MSRIVKIVRNSERFWVSNVRELDGDLVGEVDNDLICDHPFSIGDTIKLTEDEIIGEWKDE